MQLEVLTFEDSRTASPVPSGGLCRGAKRWRRDEAHLLVFDPSLESGGDQVPRITKDLAYRRVAEQNPDMS